MRRFNFGLSLVTKNPRISVGFYQAVCRLALGDNAFFLESADSLGADL